MRVVLLLAVLAGCTSGTEGVPSGKGEAARVEWMPYSYWAVLDADGVQTGWVLAEFGLDAGPPPWQDAGDGVVETPLDFDVRQREVRMDLDWLPPQGLEEGDPISEEEK